MSATENQQQEKSIFYTSQQQSSTPRTQYINQRILIVEDDIDTANAIQYLVQTYSAHTACDIVTDAYEALNLLSDRNYDLVLVDQRLPGMTGSKMLHEMDKAINMDPLLNEAERFENAVPVVVMSGSDLTGVDSFEYENFKVIEVIHKSKLRDFLSHNFAQ